MLILKTKLIGDLLNRLLSVVQLPFGFQHRLILDPVGNRITGFGFHPIVKVVN